MIKKYLTFIRESKNYDQDIVDECNDILIDLKDDGYEVRVSSRIDKNTHVDNISGNKIGISRTIYFHSVIISIIRKDLFTKEDISEYIGHIKSYLDDMEVDHETLKKLNATMGTLNPDRYVYYLCLSKKLGK